MNKQELEELYPEFNQGRVTVALIVIAMVTLFAYALVFK